MDWIDTAQQELRRRKLAGWLIYDFRGNNPVATRLVKLGPAMLSRRWFLFIPPQGRPTLLLHTIERGSLAPLPWLVRTYSSRHSLLSALAELLPPAEVALEYSPLADIPYTSFVDAGTVELLRTLGVQPVSSAELLQAFSAWTPEQVAAHLEAAQQVMAAKDLAFATLLEWLAAGRTVYESEIQRLIADYLTRHGLVFDHPANVSFGPHTGDPHYLPIAGADRALQAGDVILIDLWARCMEEGAPYADITWMGCYGEPSAELARAFTVVCKARELAVSTIAAAYRAGRWPPGWEIDRAVRDFIGAAGYGEAFWHRTGHSLGWRFVHGDAVNLDDFETHDTRELRPGLGITVEPGVYFPHFGVRSEIDVLLTISGPQITTEEQAALTVIPAL